MSVVAVNGHQQGACISFEHAWSYGAKIAILARHIMNAIAKDNEVVKRVVTRLKLSSIVGVPYTLRDIFKNIQACKIQVCAKDEVLLRSLSLAIMVADVIDSVGTFVNASLTLHSQGTIRVFSVLSLPLAFGMASLGTLSRTIKVAKIFFLSKDLIKNRQELLRAAPIDAKKELEVLYLLLQNPVDALQIARQVDKVQEIFKNKMLIDLLGILANIVVLSALTLFLLGTGGAMPFILMAIAFSIRLTAQTLTEVI